MKYHIITPALFLFGTVAVSSVTMMGMPSISYADRGIQIEENSVTKQLMPLGQSDEDTKVYSDVDGLSPRPNVAEIQQNENFVSTITADTSDNTQSETIEMKQTPEQAAAEKFEFFDKDDNGVLSMDEFFLYELSSDARHVFYKVDKNDDLIVSYKEFRPYHTEK